MLRIDIERTGNDCPFQNENVRIELDAGECLWLQGVSGAGKSSIALHLLGLKTLPGAKVKVEWKGGEKVRDSIGMVFQQGVLVDALSLEENIALALRSSGRTAERDLILEALRQVGLDDGDRAKMPGQLSGGMLRRASLAQVLAQRKRIIVLDEPFVGLDEENALGIVRLIQSLQADGIIFLLISHEPQYALELAAPGKEIRLEPRARNPARIHRHRVSHGSFAVRTWLRLVDYLGISSPLILFAFLASGFAISLLFNDLLEATSPDVIKKILLHTHPGLIKKMLGYELYERFVGHEFDRLASVHLPELRRQIFALGVAKGFVIELGPLLTALLLAGRIGGSYAGEVGMMQATNQNSLLQTLGRSPRAWMLGPSSIAALISAPVLTGIGIVTCLFTANFVAVGGLHPLFPDSASFWIMMKKEIFTCTSIWTWPPFCALYHSLGFMIIILLVAEIVARRKPDLQPRHVPKVVTWSVVFACVLIILADWGFSQILLHAGGGLGAMMNF